MEEDGELAVRLVNLFPGGCLCVVGVGEEGRGGREWGEVRERVGGGGSEGGGGVREGVGGGGSEGESRGGGSEGGSRGRGE